MPKMNVSIRELQTLKAIRAATARVSELRQEGGRMRVQAAKRDHEADEIQQRLAELANIATEGPTAVLSPSVGPAARGAPASEESGSPLTVKSAILQAVKGITGKGGLSAGALHRRVDAIRSGTPYKTFINELQTLARGRKIGARGRRPRKYFERH